MIRMLILNAGWEEQERNDEEKADSSFWARYMSGVRVVHVWQNRDIRASMLDEIGMSSFYCGFKAKYPLQ